MLPSQASPVHPEPERQCGCRRRFAGLFAGSPQKHEINEAQMNTVGASVLEEQRHLRTRLHSSLKMSGFETNAVRLKKRRQDGEGK